MTIKEVIQELAQMAIKEKSKKKKQTLINAINLLMVHALGDGEIISLPTELER